MSTHMSLVFDWDEPFSLVVSFRVLLKTKTVFVCFG